ncbi:Type I transmembrane sorting receptor [Pseudocyphellaria aurata]|nr:Type I transmembrane sorting receptor [Pseudocyphellaria aurata]
MRFTRQLSAASALLALVSASPFERRDIKKEFTIEQTVPKPFVPSGPAAVLSTYNKFNVPAPEDVVAAAAANDGTAPASPTAFDSQYLTPVTIGGQTVNLDFDTGSADLWVFSSELSASSTAGHQIYDPSLSSTAQYLSGYTWRITYGDKSSASGDVYTDTVSVGGTTVAGQAVELASKISAQFQRDVDNDGLLGLSFSQINRVQPTKQKTFLDNAKSSLTAPLFTVDLKKGSPGTYSFGFIDDAKYTGEIAYVPVDNSRGFWEFKASGFAVGGESLTSTSIDAIADTGTTLLYLPSDVVDAYYRPVSGASYNSAQGGYTFPCGTTLPSITLAVGRYDAVVPGSFIEYAPIDSSARTCFGGIQSNEGIGFSIFGDIFLKSQFVVFDGSDSPRLGFAAKPL